jgi:cytochrome c-type biogenesis protein CcmF
VAPFRENPRRYGGYVVHLGIVLIFLGIAFSSVFQTQYQESLKVGDEVSFGPYTVRLRSFDTENMERELASVNEQKVWVNLEVFEGGRFVSLLQPMRVYYPSNPEQPSYEVAVRSTMMRDFYTLLAGFDIKAGTAIVGAFVNPMVAWIWVGTVIILLGGLVALAPMKRL